MSKSRKRPCTTCGRDTLARTGLCRMCARKEREQEDALTGDEWRPDPRGIQRHTSARERGAA